jgi:uncharacterized membrane protein
LTNEVTWRIIVLSKGKGCGMEKGQKIKNAIKIGGIVLLAILLIPLALYVLRQVIALVIGLIVIVPATLFSGKRYRFRGRRWWR